MADQEGEKPEDQVQANGEQGGTNNVEGGETGESENAKQADEQNQGEGEAVGEPKQEEGEPTDEQKQEAGEAAGEQKQEEGEAVSEQKQEEVDAAGEQEQKEGDAADDQKQEEGEPSGEQKQEEGEPVVEQKQEESEPAGEQKQEEGEPVGEQKQEEGEAAGEQKQDEGEATGEQKQEEGEAAGEQKHEDGETAGEQKQEGEATGEQKQEDGEAAGEQKQEGEATGEQKQENGEASGGQKQQEEEAAVEKPKPEENVESKPASEETPLAEEAKDAEGKEDKPEEADKVDGGEAEAKEGAAVGDAAGDNAVETADENKNADEAKEEAPAEEKAVEEERTEGEGNNNATAEADAAAADPGEQQVEAPAEEAGGAPEESPTEDGAEKEKEEGEGEPTAAKEDAEPEEEQDQKPAQDSTAEAEPQGEEPPAGKVSPAKKEEEEGKPEEPVQVEADVSEAPPGSPKVALEEKGPNVNLDATATVKFVLMPSGQVVTLACTLGQTLDQLKTHFAYELKMPRTVIMLMFDGKSMPDSTLLADLGVGPNGTIQLEMQSADPVNTPIKPYRPRQEYHMPDVITVRVMTEDCEAKEVVVEIERSRFKKPYLGGFRNKNSGVEFHNASAQTVKKPRPPPTIERFCRDTQTCEQKNMKQQTTNTTSTQMIGVGVFIGNMEDKLVVPGKYFSADEHLAMILKNVIILQKYYRRWLAKRYVTKLKEDKARRLEWERQEEMRKKREKEERIKRDYARRLNPKTKADFDMLLHCLEKWRQEEMERINSTLTGAERKAALCMLLDQETELLSAIERHKNEAYDDNKDKRIMAFLDKAAAPKKWQGHDGKLTYMDTPFTIRAKELRDIFNSINMKYLTQDERLDVLLTLKHTVKEHDCKLTQEIIELIDREADLLMRGVKEGNLTGLRKRISTLFLQYIKTPTFNPEAARLLKVPQDPSTLRKNVNYCHSCGNYLPSTDFFITSNSKHVGRCRRCVKIENDGRQREDHTFYRVMLKALRKSEETMQDGSSICFLLQEHDLRYLVENIWSNQSVLSAWDDLYDLVLVRWDKHQEWSPWNCILLTHDEAEAHKKLFSLEEGYGHVFIHKVTQKHNFARNYFSRLPGMAELLRQKLGNRDLTTNNGPSVSGQPISKAQKV